MSLFVPPQRPGHELLDDPNLPGDEMARSLAEIAGVDRWWGGSRTLARWLLHRADANVRRRITILDLGCGAAVTTRRLRGALAEKGVEARAFALDIQWRHLAAGARMNGHQPMPAIAADALRLPLPQASVDFVVSTLLLHHLSPEDLAALFAEIRRVARRGFALLDLRRHRVPLVFLALAGRALFDSRTSRHDGPVSVRRAYTPKELRRILRGTVPAGKVERLFPFRLLVSFSRPETDGPGA